MSRTRADEQSVRRIGEFGLIRLLETWLERGRPAAGFGRRSVIAGIGDDCAVLPGAQAGRYLLYTCDPVVEAVHFLPGTPGRQVGWKAMARNLSDIAAMGGMPRWAVVSLGLRSRTRVRYVRELYRGLQTAAERFGCLIVGGDTTRVAHEQFVVVTLIGEVERRRLTLRSGARAGDVLLVTGALGGSLRGKHLRFTPRLAEARWLTAHAPIHAMIDLSDGLSSDLNRLLEANPRRVGFEVEAARIPVARAAGGRLEAALNDGEDFELLCAVPRPTVRALLMKWRRQFPLRLTEIGRVRPGPREILLCHPNGTRQPLKAHGYDHFATP